MDSGKGAKMGSKTKSFSVKKYQTKEYAHEAAKRLWNELVEEGKIRPKKVDPRFRSEVPGVSWKPNLKKWAVEVYDPHKESGARIPRTFGGNFPFEKKKEAEQKAKDLIAAAKAREPRAQKSKLETAGRKQEAKTNSEKPEKTLEEELEELMEEEWAQEAVEECDL